MDISKTDAKVCVRIAGAGRRKTAETVTTWGAMTGQILMLRDHLAGEQVTCVVMEATGDYWKPFYYLLEDLMGTWQATRRGSPGLGALRGDRGACLPDPRLPGAWQVMPAQRSAGSGWCRVTRWHHRG
jgi:hypothetical protein